MSNCLVRGCIPCNTHITALHICPICNCRGHGPEECGNRNLIRNLERESIDSLPRHLHCQNPYCPKKETHTTNVCHEYIKLIERLWKKIEVDTNNLILYHNSEFGSIQRNVYNILEKKISENNYRMINLVLKIPISIHFEEYIIYARLSCVRHTNSEHYLDIDYILIKPENLTRNDIKNESNLLEKYLENYEVLYYDGLDSFNNVTSNTNPSNYTDMNSDSLDNNEITQNEESTVNEESTADEHLTIDEESEDEESNGNDYDYDDIQDELRSIERGTIINIMQRFPDFNRLNETVIQNRQIINIINHQRGNLIIENSLFNSNNNRENNDGVNTNNEDETMDDEYEGMPPLEPVETNTNDSNINDSNVYLDDTIARGTFERSNLYRGMYRSNNTIRLRCPECRTENTIPSNNSMVKGIDKECSVCLNASATTYFPQCGHIVCCQDCLSKLPRI